ncbi:hypothetical protein [Streptomyces sp. JJ38]|uniref:hypothetical protein n=1 Tax=Streptomyces sp. JJ38 TaxID=2738128 RepID=UPI001C599978|nr:hypothetical protein [Streptomyces sp. JJ38]MBW1599403.1 hypothetical protein [Streptomyces sp. JJ38]
MQPTAGPDLPHTHSRSTHWLATAAAVGVLVAAAALVQPAGAAPGGGAAGPSPGPDPTRARYAVDCGPWDLEVTDRGELDFDADGRAETVAVVRCATGTGTPPSGMYVVAHGQGAPGGAAEPRIAAALVEPADHYSVDGFAVRDGRIAATLHGYSSPDVPRCCPDEKLQVTWEWRDGGFSRRAASAAVAAG